jgi:hypothetical protein
VGFCDKNAFVYVINPPLLSLTRISIIKEPSVGNCKCFATELYRIMSQFSDKIRLVPDRDVRSVSIVKRKQKIYLLLVIVTVTILLYNTSRRSISPITHECSIFTASDDKRLESDKKRVNIIDNAQEIPLEKNVTKYVLFWTRFFNNPDWYTGKEDAGEEVLKSVQCPVTNCFFTHNKDLLDKDITKFDAIAFHGPEYRTTPLPYVRSPHQLYIFVSLE